MLAFASAHASSRIEWVESGFKELLRSNRTLRIAGFLSAGAARG